MTRRKFLESARRVHGYKYDYPNLGDKILTNDYIDVLYKGEMYRQKVRKHIYLGRCPEKNQVIKSTSQFIKDSKQVWGDKYDYSLVDYRGSDIKVPIIYDGIIYYQTPTSHLKSAPEYRMNKEWFIRESIKKWGDRFDYSFMEFECGTKKVKIIDNSTGDIYYQTPISHLKNDPANIKLSVKKTTIGFIEESSIMNDFKLIYDKTKYVNNKTNVIMSCPLHGDFKQKPIYHLQGNGCPKCVDDEINKFISKFLNRHKINFIKQYKFKDSKNVYKFPFDFYIPSFRTCIDFNSIIYYQSISELGGLNVYNKVREINRLKIDYCEDNYVDYIVIAYNQINYIESILNKWIKSKKK